jgi:hypothetical protein
MHQKKDPRIDTLKRVYEYYDRLTADTMVACRKFCALCCTANVTMTSLEGNLIVSHLESQALEDLSLRVQGAEERIRFKPQTTANRMAALCMEGAPMPDETAPEKPGVCPLLEASACSIYRYRPFGCRSMLSIESCNGVGFARMDHLILSINTVFLQFIEHLDTDGVTGNLTDVLQFELSTAEAGSAGVRTIMVANQPVKRLMIPPEHQECIYHVVQELNRIGLGIR